MTLRVITPRVTDGLAFPTRQAFLEAGIPPVAQRAAFIVGGRSYAVTRDSSGPIEQANGDRWAYDPPLEVGDLNVIAHRGGVQVNVQNTMPALTGCLSWAQSVETDVVTSSDGALMLFHDTTVNALTNGAGDVRDFTEAQLRDLKFTALIGTPMEDIVRIPRFDEFLKWAVRADVQTWPEIKLTRTEADVPLFAQAVIDAGAWEKTVLQSFSLSRVLTVLASDPRIKCGRLRGDAPLATLQDEVEQLSAFPDQAYFLLNFPAVLNNPSIVEYCRKARVGLGVWTVNVEADFNALIDLGVRNIMTDLPLGRGNRYA